MLSVSSVFRKYFQVDVRSKTTGCVKKIQSSQNIAKKLKSPKILAVSGMRFVRFSYAL